MEESIIVDENDSVIGAKPRDEITSSDIYRVSALWITDTKGSILLARRAYTKKVNPGVWGPAVVGTVEVGEEYDTNIVKEIEEEIGLVIPIVSLTRGEKIKITSGTRNYFCQWYKYHADIDIGSLTLEEEGVAEACWFTEEEIRDMVRENPQELTPNAPQWLKLFITL
jgi:isopentenyldiphosphate isomerase